MLKRLCLRGIRHDDIDPSIQRQHNAVFSALLKSKAIMRKMPATCGIENTQGLQVIARGLLNFSLGRVLPRGV